MKTFMDTHWYTSGFITEFEKTLDGGKNFAKLKQKKLHSAKHLQNILQERRKKKNLLNGCFSMCKRGNVAECGHFQEALWSWTTTTTVVASYCWTVRYCTRVLIVFSRSPVVHRWWQRHNSSLCKAHKLKYMNRMNIGLVPIFILYLCHNISRNVF